MSTLAQLRALHETIGTALDDIEHVYQSNGLDLPSPDVPVYLNDPDASAGANPAEKLLKDPTVVNASSFIVAACGQLATAVQNPFFTLLEGVSSSHITSALQFLEASHTSEILRAAGPNGLPVDDLARRIDELRSVNGPLSRPLQPWVLSHILRLLAAHQWIQEVRPDMFANNRLTSLLDTGKTPEQLRENPHNKYDETNGFAVSVPICTNEMVRSVVYLSEWLLSPREGKHYETPFNYAYQTDENFYAWLERPENAFRLKQFGRTMSIGRAAEGGGSIADTSAFPWDKLPADSVIVDVGGGIGSVSIQLAEAYPHLRFVVQDRAQTAAIAPSTWGAKHQDLFESGRVTFQEQDFFAPQPESFNIPAVGEVKQPAVFLVARIMHNWLDEECKKILSNLRAAAGPLTKVIIVDQVLPLACKDEYDPASTLAPPESPLLPNLGKAYASGYQLDLAMISAFNGKERTLREFTEITGASGWQIAHVERAKGSFYAYTTLSPV